MCRGNRLYETTYYFGKLTLRKNKSMKRKSEQQAEAVDYPTLHTFRENQKAILKTVGAGAVGLAMSSCQPEPPVLRGVPPMPPVEGVGTATHVGDGQVNPEEGIPLGGVVCPPE